MKAREKEAKRSLSVAELKAELHQAQEKHWRLRLKHAVTPLPNPLEVRDFRRHIARLKTWIGQREAPAKAPAAKEGA